MRGKQRRGRLLLLGGLLLIAAALFLTSYNLWAQYQAGIRAKAILAKLSDPEPDDNIQAEPGEEAQTDGSREAAANGWDPDMEMPVKTVDGNDYIGTLFIPALDLELPVMSEWSYPNLRIAPCRYTGTAYKGNFVIAAHNYSTHFGRLKELLTGDCVIFTDMAGNVLNYEVVLVETLEPTAVEKMELADWDLSLFTCTIGGAARVTVRCRRTEA